MGRFFRKFNMLLTKVFFGFCLLITLLGLASSDSISDFAIVGIFFGGLTFWQFKRMRNLKTNIVADDAEEEAHGFSRLESTHEDYSKNYQEKLDKYIEIQKNITSNDDYDKLKIVDAIDASNGRGYFKLGTANCRIRWLDATQHGRINLMALLMQADDLAAMDSFGGVMTFIYPAIQALNTSDKTVADIAHFISDKSIEQIQALQAENLSGTTEKIDRNEFKYGTKIFDVELKTRYDVAADEVNMGFSILIVQDETRQKFSVTREKILNAA
ncbi:MAG: hypothetical protein II857_06010 [Selenomonadaceae bacterium]|nr:hypothetical protein [Selenomonadaceae bacterium]